MMNKAAFFTDTFFAPFDDPQPPNTPSKPLISSNLQQHHAPTTRRIVQVGQSGQKRRQDEANWAAVFDDLEHASEFLDNLDTENGYMTKTRQATREKKNSRLPKPKIAAAATPTSTTTTGSNSTFDLASLLENLEKCNTIIDKHSDYASKGALVTTIGKKLEQRKSSSIEISNDREHDEKKSGEGVEGEELEEGENIYVDEQTESTNASLDLLFANSTVNLILNSKRKPHPPTYPPSPKPSPKPSKKDAFMKDSVSLQRSMELKQYYNNVEIASARVDAVLNKLSAPTCLVKSSMTTAISSWQAELNLDAHADYPSVSFADDGVKTRR